jgi:hypothetical protein
MAIAHSLVQGGTFLYFLGLSASSKSKFLITAFSVNGAKMNCSEQSGWILFRYFDHFSNRQPYITISSSLRCLVTASKQAN